MKNLIAVLVMAASISTNAQTNWSVDQAHTSVKFSVSHLVISEVEGQFKKFSGTVTASKPDFTDAKMDFKIDVASINTDNEMRDKHLKSDDFFNAEKFPSISFNSTSLTQLGGNKYSLEGDLTIRDVTKKVKWNVLYNGTVKDPYGNTKAGFKVMGVLDRFDYNLKWNNLADSGPVVGKDVNLTVNIELKKN